MRLRCLAPGKVNLSLYVGAPREDGLHPLVSVVQPVSLADELTLEPAPGAAADEVVCPGVEGENLAGAALAAFRAATGWDAPAAAADDPQAGARSPPGMGGGSGDAAAALRLAAHAAGVDDPGLLLALAARLGGDVPSQVAPGRTLMTGAGEHVRPLGPAGRLALVILPSPHGLSTPAVYREFDRLGVQRSAGELAELEARGGELPVAQRPPGRRPLAVPADRRRRWRRSRRRAPSTCSCRAPARRCSGSTPTSSGPRAAAEAVGGIAAEPVDAAFGAVREA